MAFNFGFNGIARLCLCSGLWGYLTARVNGRAAVALERERNIGTVEAIKALPPGAELLENEPNGRLRVIRLAAANQQAPAVTTLQIQLPVVCPPVLSPRHTISSGPANGEPRE